MKLVFIDSSAFLKMYSYNYDLSENLKGILKLIDEKKLKLILTQQVLDEVKRNREKRLGEFIDKLNVWKESVIKIPPFCEGLPPAGLIRRLSRNLYNKILKEAKEETLGVDKLFHEICSKSKVLDVDSIIFNEAKERYGKGNPPGKREDRESYGDGINWIIIMREIPENGSLYFISADKDFASDLDEDTFSLFLSAELYKNKKAKVFYYSSISKFLKQEENVKITEKQIEQEKSALPISPEPTYRVLPTLNTSGSYVLSSDALSGSATLPQGWKPVKRSDIPVEWLKPVKRSDIPIGWMKPIEGGDIPVEWAKPIDRVNFVGTRLFDKICKNCSRIFNSNKSNCPYCGAISN
jgi:hypothetical protein